MEDLYGPPPATEKPDPLVKAVRSLTVAVWCMACAVLLIFGLFVFAVVRPMMQYSRSTPKSPAGSHVSGPSVYEPEKFEGKDFHDLNPEKQIQYASVILLTKHVKDAKGKTKSVISEIVKQKPGTELHYKVGEEFAPYGSMPMNETCTGDGEIVLMVGSPADMREASSYTGDRLDSMGGMTLAELREEAKKVGQ